MSTHQHYKLSDPNQYFVLTWNVGTDKMFALLEKAALERNKSGLANLQIIAKFRDQRIHHILTSSKADLLLLQEVGNDENRIKKWIDPNRYGIVFGELQDTAIIYDKYKFELATAFPVQAERAFYTIAKLKEKQTGKMILAVSINLTECDPVNPVPIDACGGDTELEFILTEVDSIETLSPYDAVIVGISLSTTADYSGRVGLLKDKDYTLDEFKIPTQIRIAGPHAGKTYKIDYFAARSPNGKITINPFKDQSQLRPELGNPRDNPSDHLPLFSKIDLAPKSFWSRIFG